MSEMRTLLVDTVERLLQDFCPAEVVNGAEKGEWPARLWQGLEDAGLTRAWLPEEVGGSGVDAGDVLAVLRAAGRFSAPVPLAETLLAAWMLHAAGLQIPEGALTVAPVTPADRIAFRKSGGGWRLSGTARFVPWARASGHVAVIGQAGAQTLVARVAPAHCKIVSGKNLAGEPRDTMIFDGVVLPAEVVAPAPEGVDQGLLWQRGALTRVALMAGAVEKVMALSLRYANERIQFGKPIGKFQSVQQQLALMAGEVAAACVAAEAAGQAAARTRGLGETACAKLRLGEAAAVAAALAHQIHGAMGVTQEHTLHHSTRRLWSWREEFGADTDWAGYLGHWIAGLGPEGLWPALTASGGIPVRARE